jgi:hypothetical protein
MNLLAPEEIELNKKLQVLRRLENRLAEREESLVGFREELKIFEARYSQEVARLYAELDKIEAEIAEEEARLAPDDAEIQRRAEEARERAAESAAAAADEENWQACSHKFYPSPEMKRAYYNLAKLIHPDLAVDGKEQERRHQLMAKLNDAYAAGDSKLMDALVEEHRDSPELVKGDSIGDQLIRAIRQIYQVKRRLQTLRTESIELEESENNQLRLKVEAEMQAGRNLLSQMAERTKTQIKRAERKLNHLRQVTEIEADERFGLNVSMFR